jgi:hypothetical protein
MARPKKAAPAKFSEQLEEAINRYTNRSLTTATSSPN